MIDKLKLVIAWAPEFFTLVLFFLVFMPFVFTLLRPGREGVQWRIRIFEGWDLLINSFFPGARNREFISTRIGRAANKGKKLAIVAATLIDLAFFLLTGKKNHCHNSFVLYS